MCGSATHRSWTTAPASLASTVAADFGTAPGVAVEAWNAVVGQWRAAPPFFQGAAVTIEGVAAFVKELLASDPFGTGGQDIPFVDFRPPSENKVVAVSQRQLAFLVANVLMGNNFADGGTNGLTAALHRCGSNTGKRAYIFSLMSMLAVLSRELAAGDQGKMLVGACPMAADQSWKNSLGLPLQEPAVCERDADGSFDCGLADFMSGGTPHQALTDIAGGVVGGGAQLCDIAASQDESLVQFYSEVLAFAFFTNGGDEADASTGMLPVPFVLLGARRYMRDITGESANGYCGALVGSNWLNEGISAKVVSTSLGGAAVRVPASAFVGVASICSACRAGDACTRSELVNNQCDVQRRHLDEDVTNWFQAYSPTKYDPSISHIFTSVITRVGTGPWGAGVWMGDSQHAFLTVWMATAMISGLSLDYYIYPSFCENQGNQCFVLGSAGGCEICVQHGELPGTAVNPGVCGLRGVPAVVEQFKGRPISDLYAALSSVGKPPQQVFDLLKGK